MTILQQQRFSVNADHQITLDPHYGLTVVNGHSGVTLGLVDSVKVSLAVLQFVTQRIEDIAGDAGDVEEYRALVAALNGQASEVEYMDTMLEAYRSATPPPAEDESFDDWSDRVNTDWQDETPGYWESRRADWF